MHSGHPPISNDRKRDLDPLYSIDQLTQRRVIDTARQVVLDTDTTTAAVKGSLIQRVLWPVQVSYFMLISSYSAEKCQPMRHSCEYLIVLLVIRSHEVAPSEVPSVDTVDWCLLGGGGLLSAERPPHEQWMKVYLLFFFVKFRLIRALVCVTPGMM